GGPPVEAVRAPPVEAGLPVRSPVTPARGAGGDVDVLQRRRVTREESGRAVSAADALLFRQVVLPHLDAAYNLARWLTRDPDDAEDVVQDACVRALRYVGTLRSGGAKAWFLTIVRNAFYDWVARNRPVEIVHDRDDGIDEAIDLDASSPEQDAIRRSDARVLAD